MKKVILTDSTRHQCGLTCPRKKYYSYVKNLERKKLNMLTSTGIAVHKGLSMIRQGRGVDYVCEKVVGNYINEVQERGLFVEMPELESYVIHEQATLIEALLRAWAIARMPTILAEYVLVLAEQDEVIPLSQEVTLMFRCDTVERRRSDGSLWIRNYKTVSGPDLSSYIMDIHNVMDPWAVSQKLGEPVAGVIIEGLIKGQRRKVKDHQGNVKYVEQRTTLLPYGIAYSGLAMMTKEHIEVLPMELLDAQFVQLEVPFRPGLADPLREQVIDEAHKSPCTSQNMQACGTGIGQCDFYSLCWEMQPSEYVSRVPHHTHEKA